MTCYCNILSAFTFKVHKPDITNLHKIHRHKKQAKQHFENKVQKMNVLTFFLTVAAGSALVFGRQTCPTWHVHKESPGRCTCQKSLSGAIMCIKSGEVYLRLDYCMTLDRQRDVTVAGVCHRGSYSGHQTFRGVFRLLPNDSERLEEAQCEPNNRKGLLCAKCADGYGVSATSLTPKCVECTSYPIVLTVLLYLIIELLPITIFFILIVIFHINISSGPLMGYFIFCQVYTTISNQMFEMYTYLRDNSSQGTTHLLDASYVLSSIWALGAFNILPPLCISPTISFLDAMTLKYIRVLYPLILVPFTFFLIGLHARNIRPIVCLWRPFGACLHRLNQSINANDSIIHGFATLYFLSFGILNYISYKLLDLIPIIDEHTHTIKNRLLIDPTIQGYTREHAPYIAAAYGMLVPLGLFPAILVMLYPIGRFRNILEYCLSHRKRIMLGIFFDTLHGNFKNGLNGTRDYRCTLGMTMVLTVLLVVTNAHITGHYTLGAYLLVGSLLMIVSLTFAYVRPYKTYLANLSVSFHTATSSTMCVLLVAWMQISAIVSNVTITRIFASLAFTPHLLVGLWLMYRLLQTERLHAALARLMSPCRGPRYNKLLC